MKRRSILGIVPRPLLIAFLLLGAGYGGYRAVQSLRFEYHFAQAGKSLEREAFEDAGHHLGLCIALDGESGRAHFRAAQVARRSAELDLAGEELQAASDLGWPADAIRLERALAACQRGNLDPELEQYLLSRTTPEDSERVFVLESLVQGYIRGYQLGNALAAANNWVEARPESVNARMKRGWIHERLGHAEEAAADFQSASERQPNYRPARINRGQIHIQQARFQEAAAIFEPLLAESRDPECELGLAQSWNGLGRTDDARKLLLALAEQPAATATALLELGKIALVQGRPEEARDWLVKAIGRSPEDYEPHYQMSLALRQLGDAHGAEREEKKFKEIEADLKRMAVLSEQLQARPNDPALRFAIAEIFVRRGEAAEAARWLEQVVAADPSHEKARMLLAVHYDRIGRPDRARLYRSGTK